MKKSVVFLVFGMLTAILSGCILSKTPTTNDVRMNSGEQKTFSVNVSPSDATYAWTLDGTSISNTENSYVYTAEEGDHVLIVKAKHESGTDTQTWNIQVNDPPIADAGDDQSVMVDATVTLNGSGSTDPANNIVSYHWQQTSGPSVTLTNADTSIAKFTASVAFGSVLTFELTVTDAGGLQSRDTCVVFLKSNNLEATDFVYPVLGLSQTDPVKNYMDPITDGWAGSGVGQHSANDGHLGQDYYLRGGTESAGKPVFAVANGVIREVLNGPGRYGWCDDIDHGWGPVVVIEHTLSTGFKVPPEAVIDTSTPGCGTEMHPKVVYSLYGHLSKESISGLSVNQMVYKGQQIGTIGKYGVDQVSWTTNHLHFELKDDTGFKEGTWYKSHPKICPGSITYLCGKDREIKGVGTAYSYLNGFAPHRYVPSIFINNNGATMPTSYTITDLDTLLGNGDIYVSGINNSGQVVGYAYNASA